MTIQQTYEVDYVKYDTVTNLTSRNNPVELPTSTIGSLYGNDAAPQSFTVSYTTPTAWNAAAVGTINAGNAKNMTVDTTTGEIIVDDDGFYDISFSGSISTVALSVQLCAQIFIDEVAQDNICDFPTSAPITGKYVAFGSNSHTLLKVTAGQKISLRFLALDGMDESAKLRTQTLTVQKIS